MAELRIGTCSWKYPSWEGLVYSAPKGIDYLAEYAQRYDTVEIDQWFWSLFAGSPPKLPRSADVAAYRAAVPDDFRFTVTVPNSVTLTHYYRRGKSDPLERNDSFLSVTLFDRFLERLEPLRDVLGPLMFQFEYLNRQKMPSQVRFQELFSEFVTTLPKGYEYGIEIRNPNYLNEALFGFMERNELAPVFIQGYYMPPVVDVWRGWQRATAGSAPGTAVIRLHGPDRRAIEQETGERWDRIVSARDEELAGVAMMTSALTESDVNVYVNVNNHYEGSAPLTIERFRQLLLDV